ncbi:hypothetical protein JTE90_013191 [Oedothorax gibbosus]|uniref:Ig-like domain-containing protein n=1 Tax=Oedothorax gibbosus TaxID=931172 RepID=A0AAV6TZ33_9ARAC|nr:hypothetical protein JTE90_013191 [Oedothorax gibbosus]
MRVETKTVLTLHRHVISPSYRITISHSEHRVYTLQIGHLQESDRGPYMCQVNTVPMLSQVVYLDVVVPPEIIEERTSSDMFAREGTDVTLTCAAKGRPAPKLIWRREDYKPILTGNWLDSQMQYNASVHEGSELTILKVSRLHMAAYLCIASNGVPPAMSRRIQLQVNFPPMIWIPNQLIGAALGQNVTIECHTEAHPDSINYWSRHESEIINTGPKFITHFNDSSYKVHMILIVHNVAHSDYGGYSCIARNFIGTTEGTIRLYENEAVYPKVFKDDQDEIPRDSKYSNTSIDIQDDKKVDSSCFRWRPSTMLILLSLTVIFVRACLDILGT